MLGDSVRVCETGDCTQLHVPWTKAEAWHSHFQKQGVNSTLCLDPVAEDAYLELRGIGSQDLAAMMPVGL